MSRQRTSPPIREQVKARANRKTEIPRGRREEGNWDKVVSTGSTLLDLAISGTRVRGGGLGGGIIVEIFGPEAVGKSVLIAEIIGSVQRMGGDTWLNDTEARTNVVFFKLFGAELGPDNLATMPSIEETFDFICRVWDPKGEGPIHGAFIDSIADLLTKAELNGEAADGGYTGARRAAMFSEKFRQAAAVIQSKNYLIVCSNQIREKLGVQFGKKTQAAGAGKAVLHAFSVRLEMARGSRVYAEKTIRGKVIKEPIGVETTVTVEKSSVDKPFRSAPVIITFDYGVDDVQANLKWYKQTTGENKYWNGEQSLARAIQRVEEQGTEMQLREDVIGLWEEIQDAFRPERKPKTRWDGE